MSALFLSLLMLFVCMWVFFHQVLRCLMTMLTIVVATQTTCRNCSYKGGNYLYLSSFEAEFDECTREVCYCKCNGTAVCPPERRYSICTNCVKCTHPITGQLINAYSTFSFENHCFRLSCLCYCDGTYVCPGATKLVDCD